MPFVVALKQKRKFLSKMLQVNFEWHRRKGRVKEGNWGDVSIHQREFDRDANAKYRATVAFLD